MPPVIESIAEFQCIGIKNVPHGKDWHCQQNPNQLMQHIVLTVAKLPGNIGRQRPCLLNVNAAWKPETNCCDAHADFPSQKQIICACVR